MSKHDRADGSDAKYLWGFLAGLVAGSLVAAVAMLLFAPQSGKRTRAEIRRKSANLHEQTTDAVGSSLEQARAKAGQITLDVREKTGQLGHGAQVLFDEQSERVSSAVKAGKDAIHDIQG